eukprot:m51a1_g5639 hypothetical protein (1097) ;mRNA; f:838430-846028
MSAPSPAHAKSARLLDSVLADSELFPSGPFADGSSLCAPRSAARCASCGAVDDPALDFAAVATSLPTCRTASLARRPATSTALAGSAGDACAAVVACLDAGDPWAGARALIHYTVRATQRSDLGTATATEIDILWTWVCLAVAREEEKTLGSARHSEARGYLIARLHELATALAHASRVLLDEPLLAAGPGSHLTFVISASQSGPGSAGRPAPLVPEMVKSMCLCGCTWCCSGATGLQSLREFCIPVMATGEGEVLKGVSKKPLFSVAIEALKSGWLGGFARDSLELAASRVHFLARLGELDLATEVADSRTACPLQRAMLLCLAGKWESAVAACTPISCTCQRRLVVFLDNLSEDGRSGPPVLATLALACAATRGSDIMRSSALGRICARLLLSLAGRRRPSIVPKFQPFEELELLGALQDEAAWLPAAVSIDTCEDSDASAPSSEVDTSALQSLRLRLAISAARSPGASYTDTVLALQISRRSGQFREVLKSTTVGQPPRYCNILLSRWLWENSSELSHEEVIDGAFHDKAAVETDTTAEDVKKKAVWITHCALLSKQERLPERVLRWCLKLLSQNGVGHVRLLRLARDVAMDSELLGLRAALQIIHMPAELVYCKNLITDLVWMLEACRRTNWITPVDCLQRLADFVSSYIDSDDALYALTRAAMGFPNAERILPAVVNLLDDRAFKRRPSASDDSASIVAQLGVAVTALEEALASASATLKKLPHSAEVHRLKRQQRQLAQVTQQLESARKSAAEEQAALEKLTAEAKREDERCAELTGVKCSGTDMVREGEQRLQKVLKRLLRAQADSDDESETDSKYTPRSSMGGPSHSSKRSTMTGTIRKSGRGGAASSSDSESDSSASTYESSDEDPSEDECELRAECAGLSSMSSAIVQLFADVDKRAKAVLDAHARLGGEVATLEATLDGLKSDNARVAAERDSVRARLANARLLSSVLSGETKLASLDDKAIAALVDLVLASMRELSSLRASMVSSRAPAPTPTPKADAQQAQAAVPSPKAPADKAQPAAEQSMPVCVLCKERPRQVALRNCGHCVLCKQCSVNLKRCPVCQEKIKKAIPVILCASASIPAAASQ